MISYMSLTLKTSSPISLTGFDLGVELIQGAITLTNQRLTDLSIGDEAVSLELYKIIDLRMLSGLIGELFVSNLSDVVPVLFKNPSIDGYPDLLNLSSVEALNQYQSGSLDVYLNFPSGGIEVKNTFGVKKTGITYSDRDTRFSKAESGISWKIQRTLVWKAHHRETNHLLALHSDYVNQIPQIIGCFYSDELDPEDWSVKQQPKVGSTMTSFCATRPTAFAKLKRGVIALDNRFEYEDFLK